MPDPCVLQIRFWGIDSGIRHSVGGSDYRSVRVGAFMGLKVISQTQQRQQQLLLAQPSSSVAAVLTEVTSTNRTPSPSGGGSEAIQGAGSSRHAYMRHQQQQRLGGGGGGFFDAAPAARHQQSLQQPGISIPGGVPSPTVADSRGSSGEGAAGSSSRCMPSSFGGYLANISPSEYRELYEAELPAALMGSDFLRTYGPHLDTATAVDPGTLYAVKDPTVHPIQENHR